MQAFQGTAGTFDRATYRSTLRQNNTNEAEFEAGLRADIARSLLQETGHGIRRPASMTGAFDWAGERRGFTLLRLSETNLATPVPAPTEELKAYYDAHVADYTRPEARRIAYAALLPDTLAPTMTIPDEDVKRPMTRGSPNSSCRKSGWSNGWSSAPRKRRRGQGPARCR